MAAGVLTTATLVSSPAQAADSAGDQAIASAVASVPTDAAVAKATTPLALLKVFVRCYDIGSAQQYCLHVGLMSPKLTPAGLDALLQREAAANKRTDGGGVTTLLGTVKQLATLPYAERRSKEEAEIRDAVGTAAVAAEQQAMVAAGAKQLAAGRSMSVAPAGARAAAVTPTSKLLTMAFDDQDRNYYCGPASVWMVAGGHSTAVSQATWASRLGTTTDGTAVSSIPGVLNSYTDRDAVKAYGSYSMGNYNTSTYLAAVVSGIAYSNHPVVQQVKLWKSHFSYLAKDHGGHYQPVRGYNQTYQTTTYNEPYQESRWTVGGNNTAGGHTLLASVIFPAIKDSYNANPGVWGRVVY